MGRDVKYPATAWFPRFHSIGCPSEWGVASIHLDGATYDVFPFNWLPQRVGRDTTAPSKRDRILFPFNWLPQRVGRDLKITDWIARSRFHSIGCPSEWGGLLGDK